MILTCPRCATRYLADPLQVWATGRTVQCAACGQRWRAVGEGAQPAPQPAPSPPVEPPPSDDTTPVPAAPAELAEPVVGGPQADPEPAAASPDWHAALPATPPASDNSLSIPVFRPPPRLTTAFGSGPSRAGRWLAIVFLVVLAAAAFVMFRDVIVAALPGLAPIYAAMGLLVHPATLPHA